MTREKQNEFIEELERNLEPAKRMVQKLIDIAQKLSVEDRKRYVDQTLNQYISETCILDRKIYLLKKPEVLNMIESNLESYLEKNGYSAITRNR